MRQDTPFGPIWIYPDMLGEKLVKKGAQIDLMWPNSEGFIAMHTGPAVGGAWVVRAPMEALEAQGYRTDSAAEHPVAEGTIWPPIHIPVPMGET